MNFLQNSNGTLRPSLIRSSFIFLSAFFLFQIPAFAELPEPEFKLQNPGKESVVDYRKYGEFREVGTDKFHYAVKDAEGLERASGSGVYPSKKYYWEPEYIWFWLSHTGKIDPWAYTQSGSNRNDFFVWWSAGGQPEGIKLFYEAEALRRAGLIHQAMKVYYSIVVHFPKTVMWSSDGSFYWYVAPEAISRIRKLCAVHPELGLELKGAFVEAERGPENKPDKDIVRVWPGEFVQIDPSKEKTGPLLVTQKRGNGRVRLQKYDDRYWRILVDGKPFFVKGVTYTSTTVGESAHALNLRHWMRLDDNKNNQNDGMFDSWIDTNGNNKQDSDEPVVGDAKLLKEMGANAIRVYHGVDEWGKYNPKEYDKELMRTLNKDYGIFFIMGDFLGAYTVGSKANWELGTDYTDEEQKLRMMQVVREMVMDHKDEPYVLMWLLGNENQHPHTHTNADRNPKAYAEFLNEVAKMIHDFDPDHPVAVGNLYASGVKELARYAPEVDIYGANVYSGAYSMGSVWQIVRHYYDRPLMITEFGCDVYDGKNHTLDPKGQADYFRANWEDIAQNSPSGRGEGNAIGGVFFEWMDEWWKGSKGDSWGDPQDHNTEGDFQGAFPDGWMHEEWLGIFGQGDGSQSHFLREPRAVYDAIREAWTAAD